MKIDLLTVGSIGIMAVGGIANAFNTQQRAITAASDSVAVNTVATEIASESLAASAALAESRYESGACIISTIPITEQMAVPTVYAGGIICDRHGMTAVVARDGRLVLLARTGNQAKITQGLQ
jgi:hypothetical protein